FRYLDEEGVLHGTPYVLEDSIHNHIRLHERYVTHRKGSTELKVGKTVVIPLSMSRGSLLVTTRSASQAVAALNSCAHGAGRRLSRFDAMKYWNTVLKEKERKAYKKQFSELLDRSGNFPSGYIQEFDFAYKDASDIIRFQPYLKMVAKTMPIVTVKYSEI
ncbi:MAG: RtcB family protein, partial [Chitinophagaceae bacterium]|nr:RtcB family protein [Chitinophagaceae bacterium]